MFAGEALEPQRLRTWLDNHPGSPRLLNLYGTTETTVHASFREIFADDLGQLCQPHRGAAGPFGFFVLDGWMQAVPAGVVGELYVAGGAAGYGLLAAAGFDVDAVCGVSVRRARGATRMYRTGDLAWWGADGQLRYVGRADDQVKIRGYPHRTR